MEKGETAAKSGSFLKTLLILALIAWAVRSLVVAPFSIPSGSMLPRLFIGDYLLVAKWPYGYSRASFLFGFPPIQGRLFADLPERGDVVVFQGPEGSDVIKRVIGLPGDTIATRGGMLVLNGRPNRCATLRCRFRRTARAGWFRLQHSELQRRRKAPPAFMPCSAKRCRTDGAMPS